MNWKSTAEALAVIAAPVLVGVVINPALKGRSFRENDVEHAIQPVSCFSGAPYRQSPPQAVPSDSHGRAKSSQR